MTGLQEVVEFGSSEYVERLGTESLVSLCGEDVQEIPLAGIHDAPVVAGPTQCRVMRARVKEDMGLHPIGDSRPDEHPSKLPDPAF